MVADAPGRLPIKHDKRNKAVPSASASAPSQYHKDRPARPEGRQHSHNSGPRTGPAEPVGRNIRDRKPRPSNVDLMFREPLHLSTEAQASSGGVPAKTSRRAHDRKLRASSPVLAATTVKLHWGLLHRLRPYSQKLDACAEFR